MKKINLFMSECHHDNIKNDTNKSEGKLTISVFTDFDFDPVAYRAFVWSDQSFILFILHACKLRKQK